MAKSGNRLDTAGRGTELDPAVPDLVARSREGDHRAFESLYRLHAGRVYGICLRLVADPVRAEQLTQDAFVRAWQKLATYRGRGAFCAWLRRLTINLVIEDRRKVAREAKWVDPATEVETMESGHRGSTLDPHGAIVALDLERAIAKLPPGARQVFVLHDVEGYRHREIAALTGMAEGTAKAQLHRARQLLRRALRGAVEGVAR